MFRFRFRSVALAIFTDPPSSEDVSSASSSEEGVPSIPGSLGKKPDNKSDTKSETCTERAKSPKRLIVENEDPGPGKGKRRVSATSSNWTD